MANAVMFIVLVKESGVWHFTDTGRELFREPMVGGMPEIIEHHLAKLKLPLEGATRGLRAVFSASRFPGATLCLRRTGEECGGNWYQDEDGNNGWLCPALFKFFDQAPETLWASMSLV